METTQIGRYILSGQLGQGGMATVYQARDPHFERQVAVKILPREFLHDPNFRSRFQREAKTIASLEHPAIVPVYDFGSDGDQPYLVMRLMDGGSLTDRLKQGPMPVRLIAHITAQIAGGLEAAHSAGIIHRDLKPSNILFDRRANPYIADFGIVKVAESTTVLTGTAGMVGTPAYMAPEMSDVGGVTHLVDVYALGVTVYQMLTGKLPFQADTPAGVLMAHMVKPVPDPRTLRADLPPDIYEFCQQAMAKDPAQRFQSAEELAAALQSVVEGGAYASESTIFEHRATAARAQADLTVSNELSQSAKKRRFPLTALLIGGIVALVLIGSAALAISRQLLISTDSTKTESPIQPDQPTSSPDKTPGKDIVEVLPSLAPTETAASIQPMVELLVGEIAVRSTSETQFVNFTAARPLSIGDTLQTDNVSAALLVLAQGISAEVHPDSEIIIREISDDSSTITIMLEQSVGSSYHFIHPGRVPQPTIVYSVQTPVASVTAAGTEFWVVETDLGWCFIATENRVEIDLQTPDDDSTDNYISDAETGKGIFISAEREVSECSTEDVPNILTDGTTLLADADQPTPTQSAVAGGTTGGTGSGDNPTTTPTACDAHGGVSYQGTTCVCPGKIDNVTICADGTKFDTVTNTDCTPTESCSTDSGGSTTGGTTTGGGSTDGASCGVCGDGGYTVQEGACNTPTCQFGLCEQYKHYKDACGQECSVVFSHCN